MKVSQLKKEELTYYIVDKILYDGIQFNNKKADCAMVLGSSKAAIYKIPLAADLYHRGNISKLLLCGGTLRRTDAGNMTEAYIMKMKAIELGVPSENIICEEISQTTKENMICALLPLEREFSLNNINKIILITTNYHMRRSLLMAKTYFPNWIEFIPCPAEDKSTRRENWWQSESGHDRAISEAWKIICYINEGTIQDFDIEI